MIDVLSAMSAAIAVIAMLYTLWYHAIEKVIRDKLPPAKEELERAKAANRKVLLFKALPLFIVSTVFFLIFFPELCAIATSSVAALKAGTYTYNPIQAAIVFIDILGLVFMMLTLHNICKMRKKCR